MACKTSNENRKNRHVFLIENAWRKMHFLEPLHILHHVLNNLSLNSSHFDELEHAYKFTKESLKAKNNLVYSTHFGLSERIRTFFQKFSK